MLPRASPRAPGLRAPPLPSQPEGERRPDFPDPLLGGPPAAALGPGCKCVCSLPPPCFGRKGLWRNRTCPRLSLTGDLHPKRSLHPRPEPSLPSLLLCGEADLKRYQKNPIRQRNSPGSNAGDSSLSPCAAVFKGCWHRKCFKGHGVI